MNSQSGQLLLDEIAPRLYKTVPQRVPMVGSEDAQELCQDAVAMAASMLERVEHQNKKVTPGNIAFYTVQLLKSGRRSTGSSNADAMGGRTQLNGRSIVQSIDEPVNSEGDEVLTLADLLAGDSEDPSLAAARKLDWEAFLANGDKRREAVIRTLTEGGLAVVLDRVQVKFPEPLLLAVPFLWAVLSSRLITTYGTIAR